MAWSEVHDDLLQKVNREMEDYQTRMLSRTSIEVYNQAEEIAAMGFCHNQLMEYLHDSRAVDLEPLLEQEKPLEFLAHHRMTEQRLDRDDEFDRVFRNPKRQEENGEPESGLSMT